VIDSESDPLCIGLEVWLRRRRSSHWQNDDGVQCRDRLVRRADHGLSGRVRYSATTATNRRRAGAASRAVNDETVPFCANPVDRIVYLLYHCRTVSL
jgi:hypothetical protein